MRIPPSARALSKIDPPGVWRTPPSLIPSHSSSRLFDWTPCPSLFRTWALVTFGIGLLVKALPAVYATPLGVLFSPGLAAEIEGWMAEHPAAVAVTPAGWWIVAGALALSVALVARGVHHLRA